MVLFYLFEFGLKFKFEMGFKFELGLVCGFGGTRKMEYLGDRVRWLAQTYAHAVMKILF